MPPKKAEKHPQKAGKYPIDYRILSWLVISLALIFAADICSLIDRLMKKKQKKKKPTYLPYFFLDRYRNRNIYLARPNKVFCLT